MADAAPNQHEEDLALLEPVLQLPYGFTKRYGVIVELGDDGAIHCRHVRTAGVESLLEVQRLAGRPVRFSLLDEAEFDAALQEQYRESADSGAASLAAEAEQDLVALADDAAAVDDLLDQRDDSPVIRLINALLLEAVKDGASDIHIETQERRVIVRFRIDGVLRDIVRPKRSLAPLLASRIKVMARLDIAEKRIPQDGRVSLRVGGREIDVRVSTVPSQHGERVVMRILSRDAAQLDLPFLGMSDRDVKTFERLLSQPNGILLVTGPTGSGKTTTLYAALNQLNDRRRNIMTVEDPIEYELEGVGQMQVNPRSELTFARGLRAILRQDPDVIMVGEIRDQETAQVAVRASMTGHFVLSTLHTNSAVASVIRLIDMGVERFLLAPMVVGMVAQRLVRRLCPNCRVADMATERDRALLGQTLPVGTPLYRPAGCSNCFNEGYRGRIGLYEVVVVDEALQRLIHDGASEVELLRAARAAGPSLGDDGIAKLKEGLTSVEELARVLRDEG